MDKLIKYKEDPSILQPLRLIVTGTAGSGKSFLIKCMVNAIQTLFNNSKAV
jgi:nucleoside-triphosphatase THEP1